MQGNSFELITITAPACAGYKHWIPVLWLHIAKFDTMQLRRLTQTIVAKMSRVPSVLTDLAACGHLTTVSERFTTLSNISYQVTLRWVVWFIHTLNETGMYKAHALHKECWRCFIIYIETWSMQFWGTKHWGLEKVLLYPKLPNSHFNNNFPSKTNGILLYYCIGNNSAHSERNMRVWKCKNKHSNSEVCLVRLYC